MLWSLVFALPTDKAHSFRELKRECCSSNPIPGRHQVRASEKLKNICSCCWCFTFSSSSITTKNGSYSVFQGQLSSILYGPDAAKRILAE
ncbi:hypothetical protein CEXT_403331 [Caerostris extrusa]|uniref:Secreted protein n=1 Tax=Caerostris extrusa TaxID=172846 RepID=A0AAV4R768_CAEEX|nr:hypothetical protein CEXT_403331 [Caerostris extrusa]